MGGFSWVWFFILSSLIFGIKLFFGLSWLNLLYGLLAIFESLALFPQLHWESWVIFVIFLIVALSKRLFSRKLENDYFLFFYLLEGWIILSLALYFVEHLTLYWSFIVYLVGVIIFLKILFILKNKPWTIEGLFLTIILGEFFLLGMYLSIKILPLALLLGLIFWALERKYFILLDKK